MNLADAILGKAPSVPLRGTRRTVINLDPESPPKRDRRESLEAYRKRKAKWHANNKAHVAQYVRNWRDQNPEKIRDQRRRYRANNLKQYQTYQAHYQRQRRANIRFLAALYGYLGAISC